VNLHGFFDSVYMARAQIDLSQRGHVDQPGESRKCWWLSIQW